ncbi:hypothetical protein F4821DRAFT_243138 [Hypoxylon rubiginosum]|uniref:Uncharacterized protein n=1 Tax=Hypoxylon rubiginosum TaxID=110542 RepID=A0ACC0CV48_9PEZI|nr:hypothetical protein F4821DRAFT_243138 [Hypoxylon rubiginosum]
MLLSFSFYLFALFSWEIKGRKKRKNRIGENLTDGRGPHVHSSWHSFRLAGFCGVRIAVLRSQPEEHDSLLACPSIFLERVSDAGTI